MVSRAHLTMPQGTSLTDPSSQGPHPQNPPSPQHPRVLQAQHPMATRSEPQWHEDVSHNPVLKSQPWGCTRAGLPGRW